jgi:hypothetical protein
MSLDQGPKATPRKYANVKGVKTGGDGTKSRLKKQRCSQNWQGTQRQTVAAGSRVQGGKCQTKPGGKGQRAEWTSSGLFCLPHLSYHLDSSQQDEAGLNSAAPGSKARTAQEHGKIFESKKLRLLGAAMVRVDNEQRRPLRRCGDGSVGGVRRGKCGRRACANGGCGKQQHAFSSRGCSSSMFNVRCACAM